jgi:hypothetical protein
MNNINRNYITHTAAKIKEHGCQLSLLGKKHWHKNI